jgi:hypothetical protein
MKYAGVTIFLVSLVWLVGSAMVISAESAEPYFVFQSEEEEAPVPPPPPLTTTEKKPDQPESYDINYTYDPGNRRDPFVSLLAGIKGQKSSAPKGALTVTDAKVVGITRNRDGFVAIIMGADKKARFMKPGDKLYDGEVIAIEVDRVIFRQDLTEDTLAAPGLKSKEVVKRLHPVQEGT